MTDWSSVLSQECDSAKREVDSTWRRFAVTTASIAGLLSIGLSTAQVGNITFESALQFAPIWVGVMLIEMGVSLLYKSYESGIAPILRQVLKRKDKPPLTPARLMDSAMYLLMFVGSVSVFFEKQSVITYVMFGLTAVVFLASTFVSLKGTFAKSAVKEILGPDSHTSLPKKIERDVRHLAEFMVNTAVMYMLLGGLLVGLMWHTVDWPTALIASIFLTGFMVLLERSFNQYENFIVSKQTMQSLELLRLETLTDPDLKDEVIRERLRTIKGLPTLNRSSEEGVAADRF